MKECPNCHSKWPQEMNFCGKCGYKFNAVALESNFDRYVSLECKTDEEKNALRSDIESFWKRLKGYQTESNGHRAYGLAVGRVQSGKTRNYIGLMFKAIDEGYNTIIILTSKSSRLAVQTSERVEKWFGRHKLDIPNFTSLTQVRPGGNGVGWLGGNFSPRRINIGVVIKNERGHLENVRDWIDGIGEASLSEMKLLFIDDESDSATPNTNNRGEPSINNESDVNRLKQVVRDYASAITAGGEYVAQWISEVDATGFQEGTIKKIAALLGAATTMRSVMALVRENQEFIKDTCLDKDVDIVGQAAVLNELVYSIFNKKATKRQPLNWTVLRDFLNYEFGVKQERSRINRSICQLVGESPSYEPRFNYGKMLYVGYTATPFSNLLNEDPRTDPLCPDCIKPLTTSTKYFGLQRIFGSEAQRCNMNIVREIDKDELEGWLEPLQKRELNDEDDNSYDEVDLGRNLTRSHNFAEEGQPEDIRNVEWKSLKRAVMWAFCTAAARRISRLGSRDEHVLADYAPTKYRWTTMLFNISHLSDQNTGVHPVQQMLLEKYLKFQTSPENREGFIEECCRVCKEETSEFSAQDFRNVCAGYGDPAAYPSSIDSIKRELRDWFTSRLGKYQVVQLNRNEDELDQLDYFKADSQAGDVLWFVCGGNVISRGLTLDGLTVSYYDRIKRSSAVDSITQQGRWFGYRPGYELLPRIWMTKDTISEMKDICRIEESLHSELQDLFADEDKTSIRNGRNVANIRYFGRRLSGRDANGMSFGVRESKGVFEIVDADPRFAFERTQRFIREDLPSGIVWRRPDIGYTRPLHNRHEFAWKGVPSERVIGFLNDMANVCFRGASLLAVEGLVREIGIHSHLQWNVVIGNPDTDFRKEIVSGVSTHMRGNRIEQEPGTDGAVRVGKRQLTMNALYAFMPDDVITEAENEVRERYAGDLTEKFETLAVACRIWNERGDGVDTVRPTLLIDFVNNDGDTPYVQASFYWYGLDSGLFFKAIVNPDSTPPDLVNRAIEIVDQRKYVSRSRLLRILKEEGWEFQDPDFWTSLIEASDGEGARIGIVGDRESVQALLLPNIVYSMEWVSNMRSNSVEPRTNGGWIGVDMYRTIIDKGWNTYEGNRPNASTLERNGYDGIIDVGAWDAFRHAYGIRLTEAIRSYDNGMNFLRDARRNQSREGYEQAARWLTRSSTEGFALAKYQLGCLCRARNPQRAQRFFDEAREGLAELSRNEAIRTALRDDAARALEDINRNANL